MVVKFVSKITCAWWTTEATHSASLGTETYVFGQMFFPASLKACYIGQTSSLSDEMLSLVDEHFWLKILYEFLLSLQYYNTLYFFLSKYLLPWSDYNCILFYIYLCKNNDNVVLPLSQLKGLCFIITNWL